MTLVLDASVTLAWWFEDEAHPTAEAALARLKSDPAIVPSIWPAEVANGLLAGERRSRIGETDVARAIELLAALPIEVEPVRGLHAARPLLALARRSGLSAYDAEYLDLAIRLGCPLATLDGALAGAATQAGVPLISWT
ncbi:MAG: type II toxin-antitoxin system VapC family toxin [Dehalococcoidia bacterium]